MLSVDTSQLTVPKGKKGVKQKLTLINVGIRVYGHCIGRHDQSPVITPKATSSLYAHNALPGAEVCV
ncbi:hypothetical protein [Lacticaseibacillus rhamnosus]|uniref:hypothetical protein n=1 Tax=Lacticaseibacillus rhamnosus TaxID=47715 RepID=UPI001CDBA5F2|nr:hypothetical protein [Lacticaseibacillus rhamnosus]